ncbi:MAG: AMP-binding protein [Planctomycetota bacterium]|nr:AMP-binding protein [Planctomycetota bacterium]MDA1106038.1 AMP-binding protein [Planctomycetota bacterium]
MSLARRFQRSLLLHARRTLVIDDWRSWRGIDLLAASWMFAGALDVSRAPRVGIMLPTSGLFPAALMACWQRGRVPVPLNYLSSREELAHVCADAGLDACLTVEPMLQLVGGLPSTVQPILVDRLKRRLPLPRLWIPGTAPDDLAVLLYTSGTSGRPKGVMLSNQNLLANAEQVRDWVHFTSRDSLLGVLPQFHSFGLTILTILPILIGARVIYTAKFMPKRLLTLAATHRPTAFIAIPSMYNALASARDVDADAFRSLTYAVSGAEPLPRAVSDRFRERFGVQISEGYGLTETSPVANWCRPEEFRPGSVGPPLRGVEQVIIDPTTGQAVAAGAEGEIRIRGDNVTRGYFGLREETAAAFDEHGYFRTGDIGHFDVDGHLFITGRLKEMLIISGENVFPREIEEAIERNEAVKASAVIGKADESRGEVPIAFVELHENAELTESELRSQLREVLPPFKIPREFHFVQALPRNATGKILRRALRDMVPTPQGSPPSPPRQ